MISKKYSTIILIALLFTVAGPISGIEAQTEVGTTAAETEQEAGDAAEKTQAQLEEEARKKAEAEAAKAEAEAAIAEAEQAKKEAELLQREAEIERKKLDAELKETQAAKQETDAVKKTGSSSEESRKAGDRSRQEEKEDQTAKERLAAIEQRMQAAQEKALAAEEQMKLAQERLAMAKSSMGERNITSIIIETVTIIAVGIFLLMLLKIGGKKIEKRLTKEDVIRESDATLQIKTIVKLFDWLGAIIIVILMVYMVLESHGLDVAPLLAGAGIIGLAFGFGGQYLIRDLINGLFILLEGQFRVNDVVKIGEYGGLVEDINLRITTLRDLEGRVIIIPNGEIKTVVNFTRHFAQALLDIGVAYKENVDRVMDVIKDIGHEMRQDPYYKRLILGELEMLGVDAFADSAVIIKFRIKTLPIKQWEVMREFRRRLKNRFDELGIEIPFPHRTMYWGTGSDNNWMKETAQRIKPAS
jgi:moderate conductance mechanosensitive channel